MSQRGVPSNSLVMRDADVSFGDDIGNFGEGDDDGEADVAERGAIQQPIMRELM